MLRWSGEAIYTARITISNSKVTNVVVSALKSSGDADVDRILSNEVTTAIKRDSECSGTSVAVQQFAFRN
jgi:hypothetical protein